MCGTATSPPSSPNCRCAADLSVRGLELPDAAEAAPAAAPGGLAAAAAARANVLPRDAPAAALARHGGRGLGGGLVLASEVLLRQRQELLHLCPHPPCASAQGLRG